MSWNIAPDPQKLWNWIVSVKISFNLTPRRNMLSQITGQVSQITRIIWNSFLIKLTIQNFQEAFYLQLPGLIDRRENFNIFLVFSLSSIWSQHCFNPCFISGMKNRLKTYVQFLSGVDISLWRPLPPITLIYHVASFPQSPHPYFNVQYISCCCPSKEVPTSEGTSAYVPILIFFQEHRQECYHKFKTTYPIWNLVDTFPVDGSSTDHLVYVLPGLSNKLGVTLSMPEYGQPISWWISFLTSYLST